MIWLKFLNINKNICHFFYLNIVTHLYFHRDISVSTETGLRAGWLKNCLIPNKGEKISSMQCPNQFLGLPNFLSTVYLGAHSPRVKWLRCDADHPPPSTAEVKTVWSCASTPPASSWLDVYLNTYSLVLHVDIFLSVIIHHKDKNWSKLIVIVSGTAQQGQKDLAECPNAEGSCPYFRYCYETVSPVHCPPA